MIVLIAVGVMNLAVMAALAAVIFAEKLWRYGKPFGQVTGIVLGGDRRPGDLVPLAASWSARLRNADNVRTRPPVPP